MFTEIAAVCLGLNAAYLRLNPFQYRKNISDAATPVRDGYKDMPQATRDLSRYNLVSLLANPDSTAKELRNLNRDRPGVLERFFLTGKDRALSWALLFISSIAFSLSVAPFWNTEEIVNVGESENYSRDACRIVGWSCDAALSLLGWAIFSLLVAVSLILIFYSQRVERIMLRNIEAAKAELTMALTDEARKIFAKRFGP